MRIFLCVRGFVCVRVFLCYSLIIICSFFVRINKLHRPGIVPGSIAWQAKILPLNHRCLRILVWTYSIIINFSLRAHFPLYARFSLIISDNNLRIFRAQIISCIGRVYQNRSIAWQATILPLNHQCLKVLVGTSSIIIYFSLRAHFPLRAWVCLRARFSLLFSDNIMLFFRKHK